MSDSTRTRRKLPPGPRGPRLVNLVRHLRRYSRTPKELHDEYGGICYYRIPFRNFCFLYDIDLMRVVFTAKSPDPQHPEGRPLQSFVRLLSPDAKSPYARFPLRGLATAEDGRYERVHGLMAEAFTAEKYIEAHSTRLIENVDAMHRAWTPGSVVHLRKEMTEFMAHGLYRLLMGTEVGALPASVLAATMQGFKIDTVLCYLPATPLLRLLPIPGLRRGRRALEKVNEHMYRTLKELRESADDACCVASCILENDSRNPEDQRLAEEEIRDLLFEIAAIMIEPPAVALMRSFGHLAYRPEVRQRLEQEVDDVLGGRPATVDDYDDLRYTKAVFLESLRYETPATAVFRIPREDCLLGGYAIPRDTTIMCVVSVGHRDPRYWADPDRFQPERWLEDPQPERPDHAFMPFGFGIHECIGAEIGTRAAVYLLAGTAQRLRLDSLTPGPLESTANPFLLSHVKGSVPMTVTARRATTRTR